MTNPLLKAAGITPDTKGHSAERALFDAAWRCVSRLRRSSATSRGHSIHPCCRLSAWGGHAADCPLAAFDEAAKFFQEDV